MKGSRKVSTILTLLHVLSVTPLMPPRTPQVPQVPFLFVAGSKNGVLLMVMDPWEIVLTKRAERERGKEEGVEIDFLNAFDN